MSRGMRLTAKPAPKAMAIIATSVVNGRRREKSVRFTTSDSPELSSPHNLGVQFPDLFPHESQNLAAFGGQPVIAAGAAAAVGVGGAFEPAQAFHAAKEGIKRAGAKLVAMVAQLDQHPLTVYRVLFRVVQDVGLPKAQQDFALGGFGF